MSPHPEPTRDAVVALYTRLLESWNSRDAAGLAALFASNGSTVGLDGSQMDGRGGESRSALFHNAPARFDGRPQLVEQLTHELTTVRGRGLVVDAS